MHKTIFRVALMDCPSEKQIIRMSLDGIPAIKKIDFNIPDRIVTIYHNGDTLPIEEKILSLNLGGSLLSSEEVHGDFATNNESSTEKRLLITVLLINLVLFGIELLTGLISNSLGLIGDSLDMLADVAVYWLSIVAISSLASKKVQIAKISGYLQLTLAIFGFVEVLRRFLWLTEVPDFQIMIIISILALIGNTVSLYLLRGHKKGEIHMQASWIFTSNDVLVNIGVIVAGIFVYIMGSHLPDLIIGAVSFMLVARGAIRILKL